MNDLTPRQSEIARAAVSGLSNKELATKIGISEGTLKNHLHFIYERLGVYGRRGLMLYLLRHGHVVLGSMNGHVANPARVSGAPEARADSAGGRAVQLPRPRATGSVCRD